MVDSHGDVTGEYLALRNEAGMMAGRHELVAVTGPDTIGFLDNLLSQDLSSAQPGDVRRSLLLAPQGKLRALLWALIGDDEVLLVTDFGVAAQVASDLARFKLRVDAEIGVLGDEVIDVVGPHAADALERAGLPVPEGWTRHPGGIVAGLPLGSLPRFVVTGADPAARPVGSLAMTTVRIEAGEPVFGVDVDDGTIPQETGLVADTVDFTKGCYLGQELVARIDSRGRVNRRLVGVTVSENVLPPVGAEVMAGGDVRGAVSSVGESLELRAPVALAMVRREVAGGDAVELRWEGGGTTGQVRDLPLVAD